MIDALDEKGADIFEQFIQSKNLQYRREGINFYIDNGEYESTFIIQRGDGITRRNALDLSLEFLENATARYLIYDDVGKKALYLFRLDNIKRFYQRYRTSMKLRTSKASGKKYVNLYLRSLKGLSLEQIYSY